MNKQETIALREETQKQIVSENFFHLLNHVQLLKENDSEDTEDKTQKDDKQYEF